MRTTGEKRNETTAGRPAPPKHEHAAAHVVDVTQEERRRMAECCAFFEAERYREAEPGKIRATDVQNAKAQIDAVIARCAKAASSGDA